MSRLSGRHAELLERYLDGDLAGDELAEFQNELSTSPELRGQVELQERINAGLRRMFAPEESAATAPNPPRSILGRFHWRPWAIAAGLLLAIAGAWWATRPPPGPDPLEAEYRRIVDAGFTPQQVCTDDATFRAWVMDKFGQPLQPRSDRGSVQFVGWNSSRVLSVYSGLLLARVQGREVVVLIDRAGIEDGKLPRPADPSLRQYRRVMGNLVLYEITPLDRPAVLDALVQPR
jgi:hypothetical protein